MLPIKGLLSLLTLTKRDITTIIIFAIAIGLLSLVVPIAAQGLVTIVSFGSLRQPLFILVIVVFTLLVFSAIARLLQNILVEIIQQRIFASVSLKIANDLPKVDIAVLDNNHGSELLNRFFDIMTIQKSIADILINASAFLLQALLGMILLALYHPALLAFDIVFIIILLLIILIPYSKGIETAFIESDAKYKVAGWLEEMARVPFIFHFQNNAGFGFRRADDIISKYIKARQEHYKVIIQHMVGSYGLQAIASTALFLIGGLLVLKNQMTLGQLVAAEIVTTSLGSNAAKLSRYLEKIYDLRAAAEKVNSLLMLPSENGSPSSHPLEMHITALDRPPHVVVKHILLRGMEAEKNTISFDIAAASSTVIIVSSHIGRNLLIDAILGLRFPIAGDIQYNSISLSHYPLPILRQRISFIRHAEFFDGTVLDNLQIGNADISIDIIMKVLAELSLDQFILSLSQGLKYSLTGSLLPFSQAQLIKLVIARELISQPLFMVIDGTLDVFSFNEVQEILNIINKHCPDITLLVSTRKTDLATLFDNQVIL